MEHHQTVVIEKVCKWCGSMFDFISGESGQPRKYCKPSCSRKAGAKSSTIARARRKQEDDLEPVDWIEGVIMRACKRWTPINELLKLLNCHRTELVAVINRLKNQDAMIGRMNGRVWEVRVVV